MSAAVSGLDTHGTTRFTGTANTQSDSATLPCEAAHTRRSASIISPMLLICGTMKTPFDLPEATRSMKNRVIVLRSCVIRIRSCRAAKSSRTESFFPRIPAVLASRASMAGSRDHKPSIIPAWRSSSARKRTVTFASEKDAGEQPLNARRAQDSFGSAEVLIRILARLLLSNR